MPMCEIGRFEGGMCASPRGCSEIRFCSVISRVVGSYVCMKGAKRRSKDILVRRNILRLFPDSGKEDGEKSRSAGLCL